MRELLPKWIQAVLCLIAALVLWGSWGNYFEHEAVIESNTDFYHSSENAIALEAIEDKQEFWAITMFVCVMVLITCIPALGWAVAAIFALLVVNDLTGNR